MPWVHRVVGLAKCRRGGEGGDGGFEVVIMSMLEVGILPIWAYENALF
jgi:hypothetical protein